MIISLIVWPIAKQILYVWDAIKAVKKIKLKKLCRMFIEKPLLMLIIVGLLILGGNYFLDISKPIEDVRALLVEQCQRIVGSADVATATTDDAEGAGVQQEIEEDFSPGFISQLRGELRAELKEELRPEIILQLREEEREATREEVAAPSQNGISNYSGISSEN